MSESVRNKQPNFRKARHLKCSTQEEIKDANFILIQSPSSTKTKDNIIVYINLEIMNYVRDHIFFHFWSFLFEFENIFWYILLENNIYFMSI